MIWTVNCQVHLWSGMAEVCTLRVLSIVDILIFIDRYDSVKMKDCFHQVGDSH